jgi:hypothetical protein
VVAKPAQPDGLERVNAALDGQPYKLALVPMADLELLEKNARYMRHETFKNLVENVRRDGGMASVPFCWQHDGKYRVLSGNHRVMAAKEAGLQEVLVLYTDRDLTREEQVSIQLSHNAIVGEDDPIILRELWGEIDNVALKFYSGLDDKVLQSLGRVFVDPLSDVRMDFRTLSFVFLPEEVDRLDEAFEQAREAATVRDGYLVRLADFDRLMDAVAKTQAAYNVKNAAVSLMMILDVFQCHLTDLSKGWLDGDGELKHKRCVPLSSVFGTDEVPAEAAKIIKQAVNSMVARDEVSAKAPWQALEMWAADYLAGPSSFGRTGA